MQRTIQLAKRTNLPYDPIDSITSSIPSINKQRKQNGLEPIIGMNVGEPHLPILPKVLEELIQFLNSKEATTSLGYAPLAGSSESLDAILHLYKNYYPHVNYTQKEVMICNGATQGMANALNIFIDEGDEVVVFEPYYSAYHTQVRCAGGSLVKIPTSQDGFRPSAKQLDNILSTHPRVKVLILNYPNNPTGIDLSEKEAKEIAAVLQKHEHVAIIIDDVYRELTINQHVTILDVDPSLKDRCIVVNSVSKGLIGAPGLRIGMVAANENWRQHMIDMQSVCTSSLPNLNQLVLQKAIEYKLSDAPEYTEWVNKSKQAYADNIHYVAEEVKKLGFDSINGGCGLFLLVNAGSLMGKTIPDTIDFVSSGKHHVIEGLRERIGSSVFEHDRHIVTYLLYTAGVAVVPGSGFGIDEKAGCLRFSCAKNKSDLEKALGYIKQAVQALPNLELKEKEASSLSLARVSVTGIFGLPRAETQAQVPAVEVVAPAVRQVSNLG
jgi:aspartate/methionine/tyrosine aminotransferase